MGGFCAVPTDVSFSQEFVRSLLESDYAEVDLVELVYDEVSRNLAWYGTADFVVYYDFRYFCQSDSCDWVMADVETPVNHYPLCTYEGRVRGTLVEVDIDFMESQIETRIYGWGRTSGPGLVWDDISSDIASIKQYSLNSIDSEYWKSHPSLVLEIGNVPDGWIISIHTHGGDLIHWEGVEYSAYKSIKEEKQ